MRTTRQSISTKSSAPLSVSAARFEDSLIVETLIEYRRGECVITWALHAQSSGEIVRHGKESSLAEAERAIREASLQLMD